MTIILVEDDTSVRHSLKLLLSLRDHDVHDFDCGFAALEAPIDRRQTCLIIDYLLPDVNGIDLLAEFQARGWDGPAFMITGHYNQALEGRARKAGFAAVFEKPFRHDQLVDGVSNLGTII
jgi:FixJ family two-component response regulator